MTNRLTNFKATISIGAEYKVQVYEVDMTPYPSDYDYTVSQYGEVRFAGKHKITPYDAMVAAMQHISDEAKQSARNLRPDSNN